EAGVVEPRLARDDHGNAGAREIAAGSVGLGEIRARQRSAGEDRSPERGAGELGLLQEGAGEVEIRQVAVGEVGAGDVAAGEGLTLADMLEDEVAEASGDARSVGLDRIGWLGYMRALVVRPGQECALLLVELLEDGLLGVGARRLDLVEN